MNAEHDFRAVAPKRLRQRDSRFKIVEQLAVRQVGQCVVLGEMAGPLLLSGQRAVPAKAEALGVTFTYRRLEDALRAIFNR